MIYSRCLQIAEALAYLHNVEQVVHLNVCPQSIVITKRGMWKLAGFAFAVSCSPEQQTVRLIKPVMGKSQIESLSQISSREGPNLKPVTNPNNNKLCLYVYMFRLSIGRYVEIEFYKIIIKACNCIFHMNTAAV